MIVWARVNVHWITVVLYELSNEIQFLKFCFAKYSLVLTDNSNFKKQGQMFLIQKIKNTLRIFKFKGTAF
jgi:hypothetical protein